jgi:hypothetical protein
MRQPCTTEDPQALRARTRPALRRGGQVRGGDGLAGPESNPGRNPGCSAAGTAQAARQLPRRRPPRAAHRAAESTQPSRRLRSFGLLRLCGDLGNLDVRCLHRRYGDRLHRRCVDLLGRWYGDRLDRRFIPSGSETSLISTRSTQMPHGPSVGSSMIRRSSRFTLSRSARRLGRHPAVPHPHPARVLQPVHLAHRHRPGQPSCWSPTASLTGRPATGWSADDVTGLPGRCRLATPCQAAPLRAWMLATAAGILFVT